MRPIGALFRYVLNINTIWGWMIVIAFALCVAQHYLPTTTVIPKAQFREGPNRLTIRIKADEKAGESAEFAYELVMAADGPRLPEDSTSRGGDRPWLLSLTQAGDACVLEWDTDAHGLYDIRLNDQAGTHGRLVTLKAFSDNAIGYAQTAFNVAIGLVATMVLFLGLMKVGEDAGIVQLAARLFHPLIRFLFPHVPKDHPANGAILMNMTTSILGLGNAATPFGLKAIKELEELNPHKGIASDSEVMLLAFNTAGMALIPTSLLAIRKSAGCSDPFEVIGPCLLAGAVSTTVALTLAKLLGRLRIFSVQAALAEESQPPPPASAVQEDQA